MPFKSEKQRRYLWANEPEIARDWTDTYGSRIQKNEGGISQLVKPGPGRPGYAGPHDDWAATAKSYSSPKHHGDVAHGPGGRFEVSNQRRHTPKSHGPKETDNKEKYIAEMHKKPVPPPKDGGTWKDKRKKDIEKAKKIAKIKNIKPKGTWAQKGLYNLIPNNPKLAYDFLNTLREEDEEIFDSLPSELKSLLSEPGKYRAPTKLDFNEWSVLSQVPGYGEFLAERGKPGVYLSGNVSALGDKYTKYKRNLDGSIMLDEFGKKIKATDKWGNVLYGYHEPKGDGEGQMREFQRSGYPSYEAWLAAQNQGGGGGGVTTPATTPTQTPSAFQQSLNTGIAQGISPYYVGADPTVANLAWGQQFNVDPRTMYRTTWADGGPIRQRYFLGKLVKKIGRAAKKVIKSPLGKAALIGLGGYWLGGGQALGGSKLFGTKFGKNFALQNLMQRKGIKQLLTKEGLGQEWNPWALGIMGASTLPFFMGGKEEDQDKPFDYDAAKNAYLNEIMNIKRGVMAGSLNPNQWSYLPSNYTFTGAQGGRIGYRNGNDVDPDDPLHEGEPLIIPDDADISPDDFWGRKEKPSGIMMASNDTLFEALELSFKQYKEAGGTMSRQEYFLEFLKKNPEAFKPTKMAQGGRIGYAGGGSEDPMLVEEYKKYVFEMEEMGLQPMSFEEFRAQAIAGMASGGRAGYYTGGQSIPSEYTMEDARKTAMQDRLGGITDTMKRADLYRQGDVGQMYMAEGGVAGMRKALKNKGYDWLDNADDKTVREIFNSEMGTWTASDVWRPGKQEGGSMQEEGIMNLGGVEKDYRETGGFVPIGKEEKADDVPARLSLNEFVMTADAVRGMGEGDIDKGAERMEDLMETLEVKGKRNQGASDMFEVSERLSAVV